MTTEEKAKAYDEALEKAKEMHKADFTDSFTKANLEDLFPTLKESEDERIRKKLLSIVKWSSCFWASGITKEDVDEVTTYLEKQKEQRFKNPLVIRYNELGVTEGEYLLYNFIYSFCAGEGVRMDNTRGDLKKYVKHYYPELKEACIKEQKPAEKPKWDDSDMREDENELQTRFAFYTYKDDSTVLYLSNVFVEEASRNHGFGTRILKAAEKVAETIGASSICLKVKQNTPANAWYRKRGYGYVAFEDGYDWLQKNLEYMKPAEWSEEDKEMFRIISNRIEKFDEWATEQGYPIDDPTMKQSPIAWFKDLPERFSLQPKQEWSKEDEKPFNDVLSGLKYAYEDLINNKSFDSAKDIKEAFDWMQARVKCFRPSWKPSELEKGALRTAIHVLTEERSFPKAAEQLQNILNAFDGEESRQDWRHSEEDEKKAAEDYANEFPGMTHENDGSTIEDYDKPYNDFLAGVLWAKHHGVFQNGNTHWKPSEEQMEALWNLMKQGVYLSRYPEFQKDIESLYEQLKKLIQEG